MYKKVFLVFTNITFSMIIFALIYYNFFQFKVNSRAK